MCDFCEKEQPIEVKNNNNNYYFSSFSDSLVVTDKKDIESIFMTCLTVPFVEKRF